MDQAAEIQKLKMAMRHALVELTEGRDLRAEGIIKYDPIDEAVKLLCEGLRE